MRKIKVAEGERATLSARLIFGEDDCQCDSEEMKFDEWSASVDSRSQTDGGKPGVAFAQAWPDTDGEDAGTDYDENTGGEQSFAEGYEDTSTCDEDEAASPQSNQDGNADRIIGQTNTNSGNINSPEPHSAEPMRPEPPCNCVSVFRCGIIYKAGHRPAPGEDGSPCGEDQVCCAKPTAPHPAFPESTPPVPKPKHGCGLAKPDHTVYGSESGPMRAVYGEFPWTVLITRKREVHCAGSLIHPQIVLTAANCVYNQSLDDLTVEAGAWDLSPHAQHRPPQLSLVDVHAVHPSFKNLISLGNNIALLRLGDPVEINDAVSPICLGDDISDVNLEQCVATGWGKLPQLTASDPIEMPEVMKKLRLPYFSREECQDQLRREYFGKTFRLSQGVFCAGGEKGVDMCQGDGGAPLVCPTQNGRMVQIGLVAGGLGCGKANVPGFYTDIFHYRKWIEQVMERLLVY